MTAANANAAAVATDFGQFASLRAAAKLKDPKALSQAAKQFEALFTEMILKTAHQTKLGDDLTGEQGDLYQDMFDQQMALHMSAGKGLGLADMLVRQLGGLHGASSADSAASSTQGAASDAAGAPVAGSASGTARNAGWQRGSTHATPTKSAQDFVNAIRPHAEKAAAQLGIPARALIAQAALETGWGRHMAAKSDGASGVNLFGVKAQAGWAGATQTHRTAEYQNGQWSSGQASFRSYGSIAASFDGYVKFLKTNPRYADALRSGDVHGFAQGLQKAGYATDPQYAQKLIRVAYGPQMAGAYDVPHGIST
jgi:flagellar protein FlgJ